jgi:hypothetical protein
VTPSDGTVGELDGVVLATIDCLAEVVADLGGVDVKGRDKLEVADVISPKTTCMRPGTSSPAFASR